MAGEPEFENFENRLDGRFSGRLTSPWSTAQHRSSYPRRKPLAQRYPSSTCPCSEALPVEICSASPFSTSSDQIPSCTSRPGRSKRLWHLSPTTLANLTSSFGFLTILLLLVLVASRPASAVQVKYTNCLPDSVQNQKPPFLQWVPVEAHAKFDTKNDTHNLQLVVWGNVTGSVNKQTLKPPNDPDWTNDNKTDGKIVNSENSQNGTTVKSSIGMLTYVPWSHRNFFCDEALVGGHCPLAPVFNETGKATLDDLPSMNITSNMNSSYQFASFATTMIVIFGNARGDNIGCISATITPDLGNLTWVLKIVPLIVLIFCGFAVVFAAIFSPWGSSNIFHWTSNYGRDADLLRLVTPGFGDCLQYIQFIALSGALSLSYPGFFQPVVSQVGWSALMFNESFVTHTPGWQSVRDGIYTTNPHDGFGLHAFGQLVGMSESADIWAGMMVWLCVIIAAVFVLTQAGFLAQWLYRKIQSIPEEDLRAKNVPLSIGNVIRIVFNFLLMPIVALSCFQLVVASESPAFTIALAAITIAVLLAFACYILLLIIRTKPKSVLFDDLPTVLRYGPLYNTYSDEAAAFALIPVLLNFVRGVAIGAVQLSGISQVVLLAICEVIQIFTIHTFRPFQSSTSMNAYHTLFAVLRLACVLLMVAFAPSLGVTEGPKGWIGYAILLIHGGVLALGFFLSALQTIVEVVARLLGAGGDDITGLTRGGLSKIFGMRQLSRRETHRTAPSRASQLSSMAMLHAEEGTSRTGYSMPGSRLRSVSGVSYGGIAAQNQRSSSVLDSGDMWSAGHRHVDTNSSYVPGTPGETSTFSFIASPTVGRPIHAGGHMEPSDPYYRPPRRATNNTNVRDSTHSDTPPSNTFGIDAKHAALAPTAAAESGDVAGADITRAATPAPPVGGGGTMNLPANRPDYATREVDFYYGVRGPALNSDNPGRRLGTGPADPTGPVATATGWFRTLFGGKSKEKGKGFEVVRSSRMPPDMVRNGGFGDDTPPEGIPVAMGVLRNGPIDSDDEDDPPVKRPLRSPQRRPDDLLTDDGDPRGSSFDDDEDEEDLDHSKLPRGSKQSEPAGLDLPEIPRKSSKRHSNIVDGRHLPALSALSSRSPAPSDRASHDDGASIKGHEQTLPASSTLPFDRTSSQQQRSSSKSSGEFLGELTDIDLQGGRRDERPASYGRVQQHEINRVDPPPLTPVDLLGSSAELVDNPDELVRKKSRHS
ncbi:integral membrane protein [Metarhizium rileyi]|uniref:Integral membrane protein n=1 Tax=Metarhizium rileyi (strain RCEF 4871) TaxID=1649241 RepID=A0A167IT76_METRR|nr:integral membrane protein [Metarhizium rileyi RCEF 4871]